MPLGTEVSLGLRDTVFDVDPATPRKGAHPHPPNFGPCLLWPRLRISVTAVLLFGIEKALTQDRTDHFVSYLQFPILVFFATAKTELFPNFAFNLTEK